MRSTFGRLAVFLAVTSAAEAQSDVQRAVQALDGLEYERAIIAAHRALGQRLPAPERATAWEVLGFSYAALDSTRQAIDAFRELILLDPDREPDPVRVSPRITALYSNALGQVLVLRHVRADTVQFVAGSGEVVLEFEVPRLARVAARAVGNGVDQLLDTVTVAGPGRIPWRAIDDDGIPVPPGRYQLILEATAGPSQYAAQVLVDVRHSDVDTLPHFSAVPGREFLDEYQQPPRNWRPLGLAVLYTTATAGASVALENTSLGSPPRRELGGVSFAALVTGLIMSLKKPDAEPVPANILYNDLLREELVRLNDDRAAENALRRRQVFISIAPVNEP